MPTYLTSIYGNIYTVEANNAKEAELFALTEFREHQTMKGITRFIKKKGKIESQMIDVNPIAVNGVRIRRRPR